MKVLARLLPSEGSKGRGLEQIQSGESEEHRLRAQRELNSNPRWALLLWTDKSHPSMSFSSFFHKMG